MIALCNKFDEPLFTILLSALLTVIDRLISVSGVIEGLSKYKSIFLFFAYPDTLRYVASSKLMASPRGCLLFSMLGKVSGL